MRRTGVAAVLALLLCEAALPLSAQKPRREDCGPAGSWYGGSVVAYQFTIYQTGRPDHFTTIAEGMYRQGVLNTVYTGSLVKKGDRYEGPLIQLVTTDSVFVKQMPPGKMPDINAGWGIVEMVDCNTLRNTIPFFGSYTGAGIWAPNEWKAGGKVPLVDPPDVDLLNVLNGGKPVVETYHRLPTTVNPALLHKADVS